MAHRVDAVGCGTGVLSLSHLAGTNRGCRWQLECNAKPSLAAPRVSCPDSAVVPATPRLPARSALSHAQLAAPKLRAECHRLCDGAFYATCPPTASRIQNRHSWIAFCPMLTSWLTWPGRFGEAQDHSNWRLLWDGALHAACRRNLQGIPDAVWDSATLSGTPFVGPLPVTLTLTLTLSPLPVASARTASAPCSFAGTQAALSAMTAAGGCP
eukprot:356627-Chlamydomonas_euryale.AAC.1